MARVSDRHVRMAFEKVSVRLKLADIHPLRAVSEVIKKSPKYAQIAASVRDVGLVEPPVVARVRGDSGTYLLLDGHLRLEVLRDLGQTEVMCIVSTDDEAFTYNKRISRLAIIQEHRMILKAVERGASEERIARALNVDVGNIKRKRRLLDGICPEAAEILKDKHLSVHAFGVLKKMAPLRQIESAELMVAMNKYATSYARSLLAATPQDQLVAKDRPKVIKGLRPEQVAMMERESASLDREFKMAEKSYGTDHLDLVLAKGYLGKILGNTRVARYLEQNHMEILAEFQKFVEMEPVIG